MLQFDHKIPAAVLGETRIALALKPLSDALDVEAVFATTMQLVSGAG